MVTATLHQLLDVSDATASIRAEGAAVAELRTRLQRWQRIASTKTTPAEAGALPVASAALLGQFELLRHGLMLQVHFSRAERLLAVP